MSHWEKVTGRLPPAEELSRPERLDDIPGLLSQIAEVAEAAIQEQETQLPQGNPQAHALNRLSLGYDLAEVIAEYAALRNAIIAVWNTEVNVRMDPADVAVLNRTIDKAIAISVDRFVEARERTLRALDRIALAVLDSRSVATSLNATLSALSGALVDTAAGVDSVVILLREGEVLRVRAAVGLEAELAHGFSLKIGEGFSGRIAATRQPLLIHDAATGPLVVSSFIRAHGTRALYGVPLLDGDDLIGVAHMGSRTHADFSEEDKLLFRTMATRAAGFLVQAQLHERLRQSEAEFRTLAETLPEGVWTADSQGRLTYANSFIPSLVGEEPRHLLEKGYEPFVHPDDLPASAAVWMHAIHTGEPCEVTHRLRAKDGSYRWHLVRAHPLQNASGAVTKWIGTSTDITELREAQSELQQRANFEQHLIGIVSHDLRTPISTILLTSQALLRQDQLQDRQTRSIVRIQNASERANRMISDLLDFTRARHGGLPLQRTSIDIHDVVHQTLEEVHVAFADRQLIEEHHGDGHGEWDPDRISQVVTNLTRNALTYSPAETPVRVVTRAEDGAVAIAVHNEGDPIPAEKLPHIFEPMQRATVAGGEQRNIGLGLYIVSAIVRAHGGGIEVTSTREAGTTFTVRLPRLPPKT